MIFNIWGEAEWKKYFKCGKSVSIDAVVSFSLLPPVKEIFSNFTYIFLEVSTHTFTQPAHSLTHTHKAMKKISLTLT